MKKYVSIIICAVLIFSSTISIAGSTTRGNLDLDQLISPYQEVIDKLNLEYNTNILIPPDGKEEVYGNVKDKTVEEFEKSLRKSYEEIRPYEGFHEITIDYSSSEHISKNTDNAIRVSAKTSEPISNIQLSKDDVGVQSIRERIIQEHDMKGFKGTLYLDSEIFSGTGERGTFKYTEIYDYGHYVYSDRTHYRVTNSYHKLSDSRKVCLVNYEGYFYTEDGVQLPSRLIYPVAYEADY